MNMEATGSAPTDGESSEGKLALDAALDAALNAPAPPPPPLPPGDNPFLKRPQRESRPLPVPLLERLKERVALSKEAQGRARQLLKEGRFTQAEEECRRALALVPKRHDKPLDVNPLPLLCEILLAQGRSQEALDCLSEGDHDAMSPRVRSLTVALAYCRLCNFEMARNIYLADDPLRFTVGVQVEDLPGTDDPRALEASILLARGVRASIANDPEGALADYQAAGKLAPDNWVITERIGYFLHRLDRHDEAAPYLKRALQHGGDKVSEDTKRLATGEDLRAAPDGLGSHPDVELRLS